MFVYHSPGGWIADSWAPAGWMWSDGGGVACVFSNLASSCAHLCRCPSCRLVCVSDLGVFVACGVGSCSWECAGIQSGVGCWNKDCIGGEFPKATIDHLTTQCNC